MTIVVEFDLGTLLLRGLPGDGGVGPLPVRWDPRVHHRARAMDYELLRRKLKRSARPFMDRVLEADVS